ncbi:MAG: DEAD/DEAH box helicase, partial [Planctomycetota bacterium]
EAVQQAAEMLEATPAGNVTLGQALGSAYRFGDRANVSLVGSGWIGRLLEQSPTAKREDLPQPDGFLGTLRPYQLKGFQWLVFLRDLGLGGCLADDMGLGKTIQLTSLLQHEKNTLTDIAPTLLFAPTSVVGNWHRELQRFAPTLKVHVHQGPDRHHGDAFVEAVHGMDVVLTSYALAHRDIEDLNRVQWHRIALDEAQKIKNPAAAGSKAIRSLRAPHRVALTGTPIENHLTELWSIMDMLNPGLLGTRTEFRQRFGASVEKQKDAAAADRLRKLIRPFVLRRQKTDPEIAASLPEKMEMKTFCPLTGEQAAIYQKLTGDMLGQIDNAQGIRRRGLILAILTRLKQVCDHPSLVLKDGDGKLERSGKCERLIDMLEEVRDENESALVFTQYREMGDMLVPLLEQKLGVKVHFLHGGTPQPKREEMVIEFQKAEQPQVFLLSLRAGGLGLNLTAASHVFHFDRWWNPAVENQATDRAHRIGQTKTVQVHKFITLGTVEERIDKLLDDKRQLAENIVGTGDDWLTDLSTQELRDYLSLDTSAISD